MGRESTRQLFVKFVLPSLVILILFLVTIYIIILPVYSRALLEDRKTEARDLTSTAWGVLDFFHKLETKGTLSTDQAQTEALEMLRTLRYGSNNKDYFWILDTRPVMIEHPYRPDLMGQDLSEFRDTSGNRAFLEMVRVALDQGEGYVDYYWQYEDDPKHIVAKVSHVRLYKPWNWIIGTGIYIEDAQEHIRNVSRGTLGISAVIVLFVGIILFFNIRSAARIDTLRRRAEEGLLLTKDRYRALVEIAGEGMILLGSNGNTLFLNPPARNLLGFSREDMDRLGPASIFPFLEEYRKRLSEGAGTIESEIRSVNTRDSGTMTVLAGAYPFNTGLEEGLILTLKPTEGKDHPVPLRSPDSRDDLIHDLQSALFCLYQPLPRDSVHPFFAEPECPVREVVRRFSRDNTGALLIRQPGNNPLGIVTDGDIRQRVMEEGLPDTVPVSRIMSAPLISAPFGMRVFDALSLMLEKNVHYLAIHEESGTITGLLSLQDLLHQLVYSSSILQAQIRQARDESRIGEIYRRVTVLIRSLGESGIPARPVMRLLVSLADEAVMRIAELVLERKGPAPSEYAFVSFGSLARQETLLFTDQDNGLIYRNPEEDPVVTSWFLDFGKEICRCLNLAGFRYCPGKTMASEPEFNRSIQGWKNFFNTLLKSGDPQSLMTFIICCDNRCQAGSEKLAAELGLMLAGSFESHPEVRRRLLKQLGDTRLPLDLFGNLPGEFSPKEALMPLINAAKSYTLLEGIRETSTLGRLGALREKEIIREPDYLTLHEGFLFLTELRLRTLDEHYFAGWDNRDHIATAELSPMEKTLLKKTLSQISLFKAGLENAGIISGGL